MDGLFRINLPSGYSPSRSPCLWNPVGVRNFFLFLPSVRCVTLGFGVQRRWRRRRLGRGGGQECPPSVNSCFRQCRSSWRSWRALRESFFPLCDLYGGLFQGRHTSQGHPCSGYAHLCHHKGRPEHHGRHRLTTGTVFWAFGRLLSPPAGLV